MFSDLAAITAAVRARLEPQLPDGWGWVDSVDSVPDTTSKPYVYLEFTGFASTVNGEPLGRGQAAAEFNIVVDDNKTDTGKAEASVDEHALRVIRAIDDSDDLFWSTGTKRRLEPGRLAWIIAAIALTLTPDPDPDPEE